MHHVHSNRSWLTALALVAVACAAETRPGASEAPEAAAEPPPAPTEETAMKVETRAERALSADPVTVRLPLSDDLAEVVRHLGTGDAETPFLRVTLVGLENPGAEVSVRAFVNHPQAGPETSIDDPHYLGDVGFYPTADYGGGEAGLDDTTFLLDLSSTLAALPADQRLVEGNHVDVTLMVVPLTETAGIQAAPPVEIPFESVRLSAHDVGDDGGDGGG